MRHLTAVVTKLLAANGQEFYFNNSRLHSINDKGLEVGKLNEDNSCLPSS